MIYTHTKKTPVLQQTHTQTNGWMDKKKLIGFNQ